MQAEILSCEGREVFFVGKIGSDFIVDEIQIVARGNKQAVPAILKKAYEGDVVFHNHPSGILEPSDADIELASHLGNQGIGFAIIDNDATDIYIVFQGIQLRPRQTILDGDITALLSEKGVLSQHMAGFEHRPSQIEMSREVIKAYNENCHAILEAGTGIGKSIAYLLPSFFWTLKNKEKVVISTNTINLQEQIFKKDIPALNNILQTNIKAVVVKGRSNYICLRRLESKKQDAQEGLEFEENQFIQELWEFSKKATEGTRSELGSVPYPAVWEEICCSIETCIRRHCPHFSQCFLFMARKQMASADILITNHHILCSDLAIRYEREDYENLAILPSYNKIILDEAHHFEDIARTYFSATASRFLFKRTLRMIQHFRNQKPVGAAPKLASKIYKIKKKSNKIKQTINVLRNELNKEIILLNQEIDVLFNAFKNFIVQKLGNNSQETKLRFIPSIMLDNPEYEALVENSQQLCHSILDFIELIDRDIFAPLRELKFEILSDLLGEMRELEALRDRLEGLLNTLNAFLSLQKSNHVFWAEIKRKEENDFINLNITPLDVSNLMYESFFSIVETIVLTSATLSINNRFDFIKNQLGINKVLDKPIIEHVLPSPFNYKDQVSICIPKDLPDPRHNDYNTLVNEYLQEIVSITQGSTMVLFTSFTALNSSYQFLYENLGDNGRLEVLRQGKMERHRLLEYFKNNGNAILLGTDSFWEGIDVVGEALRCVILARLPFKVPTDPVMQARLELIELRGGNPFMDFTVPQAIIKFKQGFGRLIRSKQDYGVVLCLDNRIITKSYGKLFLNSLPECEVVLGYLEDIKATVRQYF